MLTISIMVHHLLCLPHRLWSISRPMWCQRRLTPSRKFPSQQFHTPQATTLHLFPYQPTTLRLLSRHPCTHRQFITHRLSTTELRFTAAITAFAVACILTVTVVTTTIFACGNWKRQNLLKFSFRCQWSPGNVSGCRLTTLNGRPMLAFVLN